MSPSYTERAQGIYRAKYLGCRETTFTNEETGVEEPRWLWRFQDVNDPLSSGEISKFTGTSLKSPQSNAYKIAAGIVGRKLQPGDDTETHVGEFYDVVYGPNQAGNLTITSVVKVKDARPTSIPADLEHDLPAITVGGPPPELP